MATVGTGTPLNAAFESCAIVTSPTETLPAANISSTPRQASAVDCPSRWSASSALTSMPPRPESASPQGECSQRREPPGESSPSPQASDRPRDLHGAARAAAARAAGVDGDLVGVQRDAGRGGRVEAQQVALLQSEHGLD